MPYTLYSPIQVWHHIPMSKSILAVIFDLDGTLINSLADLADATNAALAQFGYPTHPLAAYRHFVGNGVEKLVRRALPAGEAERLGPDLAGVAEAMRTRYDNAWHVKTAPYPGVDGVLRELEQRGLRLGVLSNKPHVWTGEIVRHFFPGIPFAAVRGAMPGVPHKPDPAPALRMAEELGTPPQRTVFVGDSNVDILTGVRAGMPAVGVTWGFRDAAELREAGASALIDRPADLPAVLENL